MDQITEITRLLQRVHEEQQRNVGQADRMADHYTQVAAAMDRQASAMTRQAEALDALADAIAQYTQVLSGVERAERKNVVLFPGRQGA